jgi:hypothetical protein
MKRSKRILLELLGPPLLGSVVLWTGIAVWTCWETIKERKPIQWDGQIFSFMGMVLIFAYLLAGIPSIVYTVIMEWRFRQGLDPQSRRAVILSTVLGLLSGIAIVLTITGGRWEDTGWVFYGGIGALVGLSLGWMIKALSAPSAR